MAMHSNVFVDGKELTQIEIATGKREVKEMQKILNGPGHAKAEESMTATSPLSAKFKQLYIEIQKQESAMEAYNEEFNIVAVNKSMLSTQPARDEARKKFVDYDGTVNAYFDTEIKLIKDIQDLCVQVDGYESTEVAAVSRKLETGKSDYVKVQAARKSLLDYLDKTPHVLSASGQATFATDAQVKGFNDCVNAFQTITNEYAQHLKNPGG